MSKFESSIKHIPYPQTAVYAMLSDLSNLEKVRDKLPEDKIKDLSFDRDSLSISAPMGSVAMKIVEREEPKCIKFATLYQGNGVETAAGGTGKDCRRVGNDTIQQLISHQ